ncbi:polyprenyl synthetase family protein [Brevibacterium sp. GP-SGM9]|uniref:polyprenyl synthetase family protein n=1 Tax=Brevibacterium sp. GP-SGM9 TaxID=3376990 RepID=UPI0039A47A76
MTDQALPAQLTIETRMREVLAASRGRARSLTPQYERLWDRLERIARGGKLLRPRLLIDTHTALGGTDESAAIDAACAMQLLHIALVVHDDVIDHDTLRRGEPNITGSFAAEAIERGAPESTATTWGEASSLLAGDLMLTLAQSLLARLDVDRDRRIAILDIVEDTIAQSAAGEQSDVWLSLRLERASAEEVLEMIARKTSAYSFEAPVTVAAVLAGSSPELIDRLGAIARRIGIVYQLRDDVLGVFGDEARTGKSVLSDLREGKETLLIAFARPDPGWAEVDHLFGRPDLDEVDGQRLRESIEATGARMFVESMIAERCEAIGRLIDEADLPPRLAASLHALTAASGLRES